MTIGITLGDPCGIGPEVTRLALASGELPADVRYRILGTSEGFQPGKPDARSARAAWDSLEQSVTLLKSGEITAVVTAPVAKAHLAAIGYPFPGQTEFYAHAFGVANYAMLLTGPHLTVALVTLHEPLARVSSLLNKEEIIRVGRLLHTHLLQRGHTTPRIAVAGLNPHAGEDGHMGREEIDIIRPAVDHLNTHAPHFTGPHPPDTLFHAAAHGHYDAVLCMYHDQGLIPLKLLDFDTAVNVTLGLPIIRTSPDHGTAFQIAGHGTARPQSMIQALKLAAQLSR